MTEYSPERYVTTKNGPIFSKKILTKKIGHKTKIFPICFGDFSHFRHPNIAPWMSGLMDGFMDSEATFKDCQCSEMIFFVIKRHLEERNTTLIFDPINFGLLKKLNF